MDFTGASLVLGILPFKGSFPYVQPICSIESCSSLIEGVTLVNLPFPILGKSWVAHDVSIPAIRYAAKSSVPMALPVEVFTITTP